MAAIEQIRRVVTQYESRGADKSAADLNSVAAAQENVARSGETMATVTDTVTKRQISAAAAYDRLKKSLDEEYRAQQNVARGQATLDRAMQQGVIDAQEYARALDLLKSKNLPPLPPMNDNIKLASHEVTNLAAQVGDLGVQMFSGQSPFMAIVQQGPQMAAVLGDRGVKGIIVGIGQALTSLITPTTLVLAGFAALYAAGSYAYEQLSDSSTSVEDGLKEQERLLKIVADAYDDVSGAATKWTHASRAATIVETRQALADMQKQLKATAEEYISGGLLGGGVATRYRNRVAGDVTAVGSDYQAFADPIKDFIASVKAGTPDVSKFVDEVGRIGEASGDPRVQELAAQLLANARSADDVDSSMVSAAEGVKLLEAQLAVMAGTATDAQKALVGVADSAKEIAAAQKLIEDLNKDLARVGNPRAEFVGGITDQLGKSVDADTRAKTEAAANQLYEKQLAVSAAEKAAQDSQRKAEQAQRELLRDGERAYEKTRTAAERYADEMSRLDTLLAKTAISQDTYNRAALQAQAGLAEAEKAAHYDTLGKSKNPYDGIELGALDYIDSIGSAVQQTADLTTGLLSNVEDAFAQWAQTGKLSSADLVNSMMADLARYAARQAMLGLTGLFGAGGVGSASGGFSLVTGGAGSMAVPTFHEGGAGVGEASSMRVVNFGDFAGALRFHSGRNPFGPGEMPAIIKNDEAVFTSRQMAALGAGMYGGGPTPAANVNVQVYTLPGETAEVQTSQNANGGTDVVVQMRRMVQQVLGEEIKSRGATMRGLENAYGLNRARGMD